MQLAKKVHQQLAASAALPGDVLRAKHRLHDGLCGVPWMRL